MTDAPAPITASMELQNGTRVSVALPSWRHAIGGGEPLPFERNAISILIGASQVEVDASTITLVERLDDGWRVMTDTGEQFVGQFETTPLSNLVITGFAGKSPARISVSDMVKFEIQSGGRARQ